MSLKINLVRGLVAIMVINAVVLAVAFLFPQELSAQSKTVATYAEEWKATEIAVNTTLKDTSWPFILRWNTWTIESRYVLTTPERLSGICSGQYVYGWSIISNPHAFVTKWKVTGSMSR